MKNAIEPVAPKMTNKKIVHIAEAFGGGVLSMLTQLANHAAAAGVDVTVLHSIRSETPADFATLFRSDVKLIYVDMAREVSIKQDLLSVRALARNLRDCKPTAIHLHSSKAGVLGRLAARIAAPNATVLYSPHGLSFLRVDISRMKESRLTSVEPLSRARAANFARSGTKSGRNRLSWWRTVSMSPRSRPVERETIARSSSE